jgi:purine-cytosine permease-like protein
MFPDDPFTNKAVEPYWHFFGMIASGILLIILGFCLGWNAFKALKSGVAFRIGNPQKGYPKSEEPLKYWFLAFAHVYLTLMLFGAAISAFKEAKGLMPKLNLLIKPAA